MKPKVVASECCAGLHPQNTLKGFEFCLASGVDGIEFDVHLTRDGYVVVQHDYFLNQHITRDASGRWLRDTVDSKNNKIAIADLMLMELETYDVGRYAPGSAEAKSYPNYEPADGEQIPTLDALLHAYQAAGSEAELWIELKTSPFERETSADPALLLAAVLRLVEQYGLVSKTILLAFEWQLLLDASMACPGIGTDFLSINPEFVKRLHRRRGQIRPEELYLPLDPTEHGGSLAETIAAAGGQWWGPYIADVSARDIDIAHDCGLSVNVWGVESSSKAMEQALQLGADAITISDASMLQRRLANE